MKLLAAKTSGKRINAIAVAIEAVENAMHGLCVLAIRIRNKCKIDTTSGRWAVIFYMCARVCVSFKQTEKQKEENFKSKLLKFHFVSI